MRTSPFWLLGAASVVAAALSAPRGALAARFAVVIGNDVGAADEPRLQYAESDARRIAQVLTSIGEFPPENTALLEGRSVSDVRAAIKDAQTRLVRSGGDGLLLIYYSGHADSEALHLHYGVLPLHDLQEMVQQSAAATRVMVIDACRSGALTQIKGGRPGGNFDMRITPAPDPHGMAIITSSAAGEDSQESDELRASFFTHHLTSGLLGAADDDHDGAVTLAEAFSYAARHTVAATATTFAGPQHPTFKVDLGGREELVLTRPGAGGAGIGRLALREPGWYFIRREGESALVAEVTSEVKDLPLALLAGRYQVVRRSTDHLLTGTFAVSASSSTAVTESQMRRIDFGRVVRKGGTVRTRAFGLFADGGVRGSLLGLGTAATAGVGARVDFSGLSAVAALDGARSSTESTRGTTLDTTELHLHAAALKAFDVAAITWALGGEVGLSRLAQTTSDQSPTVPSYAFTLGPTAALEVPLARRYFVWLQGSLPIYLVDVVSDDRTAEGHSLHVTYRCVIAAGGYL